MASVNSNASRAAERCGCKAAAPASGRGKSGLKCGDAFVFVDGNKAFAGDAGKTWFVSVFGESRNCLSGVGKPGSIPVMGYGSLKEMLGGEPAEYISKVSRITPDFEAYVQCAGVAHFMSMLVSMGMGMRSATMVEAYFKDKSEVSFAVYGYGNGNFFAASPLLRLRLSQFVTIASGGDGLPAVSGYQMSKLFTAMSALKGISPLSFSRLLSVPPNALLNGCASLNGPESPVLNIGFCRKSGDDDGCILVIEGSLHYGLKRIGKAKVAIAPFEAKCAGDSGQHSQEG